jgi:peptidoglycan/LPS O-acetylase OafA/YrhL
MEKNSTLIETKYRKDLQVFRGFAVLAVITHHASKSIFPLGYLGVNAFFTISGFVVTPLIMRIFTEQITGENHLHRLKYFYKRRFFRLAPALTVTLISSAIIILLLGPISDHQRFARQGIATLLLVGNLGAYRYSGDYFSPNPNPLVHTWSLSVEEQIYVFLPLVMILILFNSKKVKKTTCVVFVLLTFASFILFLFPEILQSVYSNFGIKSATEFSYYSPFAAIWQFTIGGLAFLLLDKYQNRIGKLSRKGNLVFVFIMTLILFGPFTLTLEVSSILVSFIALVLILYKSLDAIPNVLSKMLEWLGNRSYSIYLVHLPVIYVMNYSPAIPSTYRENNNIKLIIYMVVTISLGSLMYAKIENRFRYRFFSKQKKIVISKSLMITMMIPLIFFLSIDRLASSKNLPDQNLPIGDKVLPWAWDENCQFVSSPGSIKSEPCEYGNFKTDKSILLIGDSHAAAVSRAIIELGNKNRLKTFVFTFQGCGFVLNNKNFDSSYNYPFLKPSCIVHNKSILDFVNLKKPTIIIWVHRSSSIMVEPNNSSSRSQYNNMVYQSLLELKEINKNIIVVGSGPEYIDQNSWIQKLFKVNNSVYSSIPFEDNVYWGKVAPDNFYYLDTLKIFCPNNACLNKLDGKWLFQDRDHLSMIGAKMLIPSLDILVKNILK